MADKEAEKEEEEEEEEKERVVKYNKQNLTQGVRKKTSDLMIRDELK